MKLNKSMLIQRDSRIAPHETIAGAIKAGRYRPTSADEIVMICAKDDVIIDVNVVGGVIIEGLQRGIDLAAVKQEIATAFEGAQASIDDDVQEFLGLLEAHSMIVGRES